jgi:hypothetical protein
VDYNATYARCASSITGHSLKGIIMLITTTSINMATITASPTVYADIIQARGERTTPQTGSSSMSWYASRSSSATFTENDASSVMRSVNSEAVPSSHVPSRINQGASSIWPNSPHDIGAKVGIAVGAIILFLLVALATTILFRKGRMISIKKFRANAAGPPSSAERRLASLSEQKEENTYFKALDSGTKSTPI